MLICRLHGNEEDGKFNVNVRWFITKVEGNMLQIQDIKDKDNVRTISENFLDEHSRYAYCSTCHSLQRTSSRNITIHEWQISYLASRGWLWCAITRGRDFNNVYFCKNDKADEETQTNVVIGYFNNKVKGWKKQDKVAGREIDEKNFVNEDWCWDIVPIYTKKEPAPHRPKNSLPRGGGGNHIGGNQTRLFWVICL